MMVATLNGSASRRTATPSPDPPTAEPGLVIWRLDNTATGFFMFNVAFDDDDGNDAVVSAAMLLNYPRLQRALLKATGRLFVLPSAETKSRGVTRWERYIQERLQDPPEPAEKPRKFAFARV